MGWSKSRRSRWVVDGCARIMRANVILFHHEGVICLASWLSGIVRLVIAKEGLRMKSSSLRLGVAFAASALFLLQCLRFGCGAVTLCDDSRII